MGKDAAIVVADELKLARNRMRRTGTRALDQGIAHHRFLAKDDLDATLAVLRTSVTKRRAIGLTAIGMGVIALLVTRRQIMAWLR